MTNREDAGQLRSRLVRVGFNGLALDAAWPSWWTQEAESSPSARAELRFSLARKLGLEPSSLLEDDAAPRFVWKEVRFKHLSIETDQEKAALASFGMALAAVLAAAAGPSNSLAGVSASSLRGTVLRTGTPFIRLVDLLSTCWAVGLPVVHLRVFPYAQKKMAAMAVGVRSTAVVLLGKDSDFPPHIAFYLAHELGHIALGHVSDGSAIVDLDDSAEGLNSPQDDEEVAADRYALELLTGSPEPAVLPKLSRYSAKELARVAIEIAEEIQVEPGTLALCFGYSTKDWATANASMQYIYTERKPVWKEVNELALSQLNTEVLPPDYVDYLSAVLGRHRDQ